MWNITKLSNGLLLGILTLFNTNINVANATINPITEFQCDSNSGDYPATVLKYFNDRGRVIREQAVILWKASLGGYSPQERCDAVSERFQTLMSSTGRDMGNIVIGFLDGNPAICAARSSNDACGRETLLFTLRDRDQLNDVKDRLEDILGGYIEIGPISQAQFVSIKLRSFLEDSDSDLPIFIIE